MEVGCVGVGESRDQDTIIEHISVQDCARKQKSIDTLQVLLLDEFSGFGRLS
jgi:hypothetical protein